MMLDVLPTAGPMYLVMCMLRRSYGERVGAIISLRRQDELDGKRGPESASLSPVGRIII
jgi:hypothetical protein